MPALLPRVPLRLGLGERLQGFDDEGDAGQIYQAGLGDVLRKGIRAFHGSPHSFEQFDSSKIGTGEGAQAYGHGLYFAEREGVARGYRDQLSPGYQPTFNGVPFNELPDDTRSVAQWMHNSGAAPEEIARVSEGRAIKAREWAKANPNDDVVQALADEEAKGHEAIAKVARGLVGKPTEIGAANPGSMYEVEIAADPEQFLDWDRPLSEQPQVRSRLEGQLQIMARAGKMGDDIGKLAAELSGEPFDPQSFGPSWHETGQEFHDALSRGAGGQMAGGKVYVSDALREAGIPGIKYLDQGSRSEWTPGWTMHGGEGQRWQIEDKYTGKVGSEYYKTQEAAQAAADAKNATRSRNFVVFPGNERLITVLKKYGLPISAAGLATLTQLHPEEAQAAQQGGLGDQLQSPDQYETRLSPQEEQAFQAWKQQYASNDSGYDYDLRGAFKSGFTPDPETGHWPDVYKKPNHPTFSDQSIYAPYGKPGHWEGDNYIPYQDAAARIAGAFEAAEQVPQESMEFFRGRGNLDPAQVPPRAELPFDETLAGSVGEALYGLPVAGPSLLGGAERLQSYATGEPLEDIQTRQENFRRLNPWISESAQGTLSTVVPLPIPGGLMAQLLGNAGILGADALLRSRVARAR